MSKVKEQQRRYTSSLRHQQAMSTRQAVLDAARDLFVAQGYGATTIDEIAARAGVSKPTVFTAVGNKRMVLGAVRDVAIAGDDESIAVADRTDTQRAFSAPTLEEVIDGFVGISSGISRRYALIDNVLRGAAAGGDPELHDLWETNERQRHEGASLFIDALLSVGRLRPGLDRESAIDMVWLLIAPGQYFRLVHERGWAPELHRDWLAQTLKSVLLGELGPPTRRVTR
jgi:AcrR family transcriptional regulator